MTERYFPKVDKLVCVGNIESFPMTIIMYLQGVSCAEEQQRGKGDTGVEQGGV